MSDIKIIEVVGAVIQKGDKFLILLRGAHKPQPLTWGLPSGKLDEGETVTDAVAREVFEETKLFLPVSAFKHIFTDKYDFSADGYFTNYHVYIVEAPENFESVVNFSEHNEHRWVTPREALNEFKEDLIGGLDDVIKRVFHDQLTDISDESAIN